MKPGRGEYDDDVVDRVRASATADPLTIELMQEVVYLRTEVAKLMREINNAALRAANHRRRDD